MMTPDQKLHPALEKYAPAIKTYGEFLSAEFKEQFVALEHAYLHGDAEDIRKADLEWELFTIARRDEILNSFEKIMIQALVVKPLSKFLAEQGILPELPEQKEAKAADLFPSMKAGTQ